MFAQSHAGNTFITNLYTSGSLQNADSGAIGGADAQPGGARDTTNYGVVPDIDGFTENPLQGFAENFPTIDSSSVTSLTLTTVGTLNFHIDANADQNINVELRAIQASTLNLSSVNIASSAQTAIGRFDSALDAISSERARLGAIQNRMESVVASLSTSHENISASRSRIVDTDYAAEMGELTRSQILRQASTAMLSQANTLPELALQLLRG